MSPLLLFPDFALIALGYALRRLWMPASAWVSIEKLVYFVLFPCLLFFSVATSEFSVAQAGWFALGAPALIVSSFALGWLVRPFTSLSKIDFTSGLQTAYRFNTYIALALVSRLGGQEAVAALAVLVALGVPLCNILAVGSMSQNRLSGTLGEMAKNPLIIGTSLGIVAKLLNLPFWEPLLLSLERLSQAAVSLGLLAVGSGLIFNGLRGNWVPASWWLGMKLIIGPILAFGYAQWFDFSVLQTQVIVAFAAIPSASSAYILTTRMGGNGSLVACLISLSTVLAAATIPAIFWVTGL
ncbi:MAG: AEC family transporter [Limnobacter sp.]|nr:AEC family transporter [Limnobacter sp.]